MATMKLTDFAAQMAQGGARANLFRVDLDPAGPIGSGLTNKLSFLCKGSSVPASTLGIVNVNFRGRVLKIAGDRTFADWSITVINDHNWEIRTAFEEWSNKINHYIDNVSAVGTAAVASAEKYTNDGTVHHLGRDGSIVASYVMRDCWPSEIAAIDLNYDSTDAIEEFTVTLQYQWYEPLHAAHQ